MYYEYNITYVRLLNMKGSSWLKELLSSTLYKTGQLFCFTCTYLHTRSIVSKTNLLLIYIHPSAIHWISIGQRNWVQLSYNFFVYFAYLVGCSTNVKIFTGIFSIRIRIGIFLWKANLQDRFPSRWSKTAELTVNTWITLYNGEPSVLWSYLQTRYIAIKSFNTFNCNL